MSSTDTKKKETGFYKGNQLWKRRKFSGAPRTYKEPQKLIDDCTEYFDWVERNPLEEQKLVSYEGITSKECLDKRRPFTKGGLCIFLGITTRTWNDWRNKREDLSLAIEWAEQIIRQQKFEGAVTGFFNANIISRDLGLTDKVQTELTGANGKPLTTINANTDVASLPPLEAKQALEQLFNPGIDEDDENKDDFDL